MLTYQAKLTCDSGCSEIVASVTSPTVPGAFEATAMVVGEAKKRGWKFTKHQALCPDCAKAIKKRK